jgi:DNA-binding response OmpR family regulator
MDRLDGLKVLVLEDDEDLAESLRELFRSVGCAVRVALGLDGAREMIAVESFDVVISDWNLGGERSGGFLRDLAGQRPQVGRILLTGSDRAEWEALVAEGVVHAAIEKPFELEVLTAAVVAASMRVRPPDRAWSFTQVAM